MPIRVEIYTLPQAQYFLREFKVVSTIKKLNSSFHFGRVARRKTTQLAQNERGRKISQNRNTDFMKSYFRNKTFLFFKIESLNFQHLFEKGFRETAQKFN